MQTFQAERTDEAVVKNERDHMRLPTCDRAVQPCSDDAVRTMIIILVIMHVRHERPLWRGRERANNAVSIIIKKFRHRIMN